MLKRSIIAPWGAALLALVLIGALQQLMGTPLVEADHKPPHRSRSGVQLTPTPTSTPTPTPTSTSVPSPLQSTAPPPQPSETCLGAPAYPEIRDGNTQYNQIPGHSLDPAQREEMGGFGPYYDRINGQGCLGTTEQILEWAARKWGFADVPSPLGAPPLNMPDLAKAMAVQESDWRQWLKGDYETGECYYDGPDCPYPYGYQSYSILMVKRRSWPGSWPLTQQSTALGADYAMAAIRAYYDGALWLGSGTRGNIWNAVGAWYCGCGYAGNDWYANDIKRHYAEKVWREPWFDVLHP